MSSRSLLTPEPAESPEPGKKPWGGLLPILAALLFGSVLLGVLVWVLLRGSGIS